MNQIDDVVVEQINMQISRTRKELLGTDFDRDHFLVTAHMIVRVNIARMSKTRSVAKKCKPGTSKRIRNYQIVNKEKTDYLSFATIDDMDV